MDSRKKGQRFVKWAWVLPMVALVLASFTTGGSRRILAQDGPVPEFTVSPELDRVEGKSWYGGVTITFDDDFDLSNGSLHTANAAVDEWGKFDLWLDAFDVQVGHVVTVDDGVIAKVHQVTAVRVESVDMETDHLFGWATPNAELQVHLWNPSGESLRRPMADANGNWVADFSVPWDGEPALDIAPGTTGNLVEWDDDRDGTQVWWVANEPPLADAGPDRTVIRGETITFDGSGSLDPDGTIEAYAWDFGDGNTGSGMTITHVYADAGTYTATLTVTDNDGADATDTAIATVQTPEEAIEDMIEALDSMALDHGVEDSLVDKLQNAINCLNAGQIDEAIGAVRALIHETEALRGKKLTDEEADQLIATAERILNSI